MENSNTRVPLAALVATFSLAILTACGGEAESTQETEAEPSVEYGASTEEYQEALADIEPIVLRMQVGASSPDSATGQTFIQFAEEVDERSNGNITIEVNWAGTIAELTEVDDALEDGRLDLAQFSPTYKPDEYPISQNMVDAGVLGSSSPLTGELANQLAMAQATNETDDVFEEYSGKGLTPLVPVSAGGALGMACSNEVSDIDDLKSRQVLANDPIQSKQVEAMGATVTFVEYTELYEAFQRGVLDCALVPMSLFNAMGLAEVAPHYYFPEDTNFQLGPTALIAGSSWETLPLAARQLIFDTSYRWIQLTNHAIYRNTGETHDNLDEKNHSIQYFDSSISEALKTANEKLGKDQSDSAEYDAKSFSDRYIALVQHWNERAEELGYSDEGDYRDFTEWFQGDLTSVSGEFLDDIYEEAYADVASSRRPE